MKIERIDNWAIGATTTFLARVQSRDGGGANTGYRREGKYITASQVDEITGKVYDLSSDTPTTSIQDLPITSAAIIDAVTNPSQFTIRDTDLGGYNFQFETIISMIDTVGHRYRVVFEITLTTGTVVEPFAFEAVATE